MATYSVTLTGRWRPATGAMGDSDCYVEIGSVQYKSAQVSEVQSGTVIRVYSKSPSTGYVAKIYMDDSVVSQSTDNNLYAEYELSVDSHCTINSKSNGIPSTYTIYNIYIVKEAPSKNHKTLIGGTGYEISGGRTLVDGTGYSVSKGRTLVGGTGYDIAFPIKLKDLPVGTIVYLNESGTPVEFFVSKHDYESGLNGSGRTLLVRKDCYDRRAWKSSGSNTYASSSIDSWLNNTYKGLLDSNIQNAIGNTSFKYTPGGTDLTNVKTLSRSVFILSVKELGKAANHANYEGSALPIAQTSGNMLDKVYYNGELIPQWTRSPYAKGTRYVYYCNNGGTCLSGSLSSKYGSRPCFTLPADIIVNPSDYTIIG